MQAWTLGVIVLGAYLALVLLARWLYIARTNIIWNDAQSDAMTKRLRQKASHWSRQDTAKSASKALIELLRTIDPTPAGGPTGIRNVLGWNGTDQIDKWVLIHEAERLTLPLFSQEELLARLERALGQLAELAPDRRKRWEDVSRTLLTGCAHESDAQFHRRLQAHLDELLGEVYEASNGKAAQLSSLYNRATWLVLAALLPLLVLVVLGYGVLLVAGAIGGIVSRMQRLVFSRNVAITYGSSWAPLFCAPVLGALAAWGGLMLIALLKAVGVLQLGELPTEAADLRSPTAAVLGLAIVLGLSERFLSQLEKQAQTMISSNGQRQSPQVPPVPAPGERPPAEADVALRQRGSGQALGNGTRPNGRRRQPSGSASTRNRGPRASSTGS